ncbi:ISNCY family transposase [Pelotomaculum terephthalicicum JT]|uniref:ISNCY family transposase n=1 Tax=Pelotomaculum terephthalicicum TaxID=206393 RepID=UPI001F03F499|nr:ISNCY family transposase [Pelotomaculum terephthalicicum]MCG9967436.1 ISNCY family transposase [Pelotomaculum terephthalicicum JT]
MKDKVLYLMSQEQIKRYTVIEKTLEGSMSIKEAAAVLDLSERQVIRLKKGVRQNGVTALIHKNQGRKPAHAIPDVLKQNIVALKTSGKYKDANFKHFQELLEKHEQIKISYASLYKILTCADIKSPKKRRLYKPYRRRKRKPQEGLLIQMDATPYNWFRGRTKYTLHGAIDDATGKIVGLYMTKNECLQGYFETTRQIILNYGIPISIYSDRHSIFLSSKADKLTIEDQLEGKVCNDTQFGRAMKELGVTIIPARSPQAKGRVERLWETLQSRLPVEFKIAGINTIDQANEFLTDYIPEFNRMFSVEPQDAESAFRQLHAGLDLDCILCVKQKRKIDNGGVLSFYGKHFRVIQHDNQHAVPPHISVNVLVCSTRGVCVEYKGRIYETTPFIKPKRVVDDAPKAYKSFAHTPPDSHYYKYGPALFKKVTFENSDREILEMLQEIFLGKYKKFA